MSHDPAASYRRFTPRQRDHAFSRFSKEATDVTARFISAQAAEKKRDKMTRLLQAAELVLSNGMWKGAPLTPSHRGKVEAIAQEARTYLGV